MELKTVFTDQLLLKALNLTECWSKRPFSIDFLCAPTSSTGIFMRAQRIQANKKAKKDCPTLCD